MHFVVIIFPTHPSQIIRVQLERTFSLFTFILPIQKYIMSYTVVIMVWVDLCYISSSLTIALRSATYQSFHAASNLLICGGFAAIARLQASHPWSPTILSWHYDLERVWGLGPLYTFCRERNHRRLEGFKYVNIQTISTVHWNNTNDNPFTWSVSVRWANKYHKASRVV